MSDLKSLLLEKRLTLAVAESLTCGHLQTLIGSISGASQFFLGGITAYTLDQKVRHLGVPRDLAAPVNCVSDQVAIAMANGARKLFGSDIAISTTGYAEPTPASPIPYAYYAIATADKTTATRIDCPNLTRTAVQQRIAETALSDLLEHLQTSVCKTTS